MGRFSSLRKIQGSIAYLQRFTLYVRRMNVEVRPLIQSPLLILIRYIQQEVFSKELAQIRNNTPCSKLLRKLAPFIDKMGVLRVGGRIGHSQESFDAKHPILLPRYHKFSPIIINIYIQGLPLFKPY